ncbi:hypothetical protein [Zooshikella sp. RANM57]|uniref:hypothetical protein n=1 Tax=Zooshikella sp. RANM57 TaxID=3425863 RepID=UPI003D6E8109
MLQKIVSYSIILILFIVSKCNASVLDIFISDVTPGSFECWILSDKKLTNTKLEFYNKKGSDYFKKKGLIEVKQKSIAINRQLTKIEIIGVQANTKYYLKILFSIEENEKIYPESDKFISLKTPKKTTFFDEKGLLSIKKPVSFKLTDNNYLDANNTLILAKHHAALYPVATIPNNSTNKVYIDINRFYGSDGNPVLIKKLEDIAINKINYSSGSSVVSVNEVCYRMKNNEIEGEEKIEGFMVLVRCDK